MAGIQKYITLKEWKPVYKDPLILLKGDRVVTGKEDNQWKGWIWCTKDDKAGWVPKQIIKTVGDNIGEATDNYSATELSVDSDMVVEGIKELNGWIWVRLILMDDQGWVPKEILKSI